MITMSFVCKLWLRLFVLHFFVNIYIYKMQNECYEEREGWGTNLTFSWEDKGSEKGGLELHRYPGSDVGCGEKRESTHRA